MPDSPHDPRHLRLHRDHAEYLAGLDPDERRALTQAARDEYRRQLEQQVNPNGDLPPEEVLFRLKQLRRALMADLALKSVQSRRAKAAARQRARVDAELDDLAELAAEVRAS